MRNQPLPKWVENAQIIRPQRDCGTCQVCCVYPKIVELGKNPLTPCHNLKDGSSGFTADGSNNCTDYANRPEVCRGYTCLWLEGAGAEQDRPDKCGILFDCGNKVENAIEAKPIFDGAQKTQIGRSAMLRVSASTNTPVIVFGWLEKQIETIVGRGVQWR